MDKNELKQSFVMTMGYTFLWGLIAHGYCYFNIFFSHDSMYIYQDDATWQISIGRFLQPYYIQLRGRFAPPSLIGVLSLLYIGIAIFLIAQIFRMRNKLVIFVMTGILVSNATITLINATYINFCDMFSLAILSAVFAVWVKQRTKWGFIWSALFITASLALYQSFFSVTVFLFMLLAFRDLLEGKKATEVLADGIKSIASLAIGLILYLISLKIVLYATHNTLANSYNGLAEVGQYEGVGQFISSITGAYQFFLSYMLSPSTFHRKLVGYVNLLLLVLVVIGLIVVISKKRLKGASIALIALLFGLMPLGINVIYVISKGMEHSLMIFSFFLSYMLVYVVYTEGNLTDDCKIKNICKYVGSAIFAFLLFNSLVFSNQAYMKKQLEYQSTLSIMTRIVDRIEQVPGYEFEQTPIAFVGTLTDSELSVGRFGFDCEATGLENNFSVTYSDSYKNYFEYVLGYPVNWVDDATLEQLRQTKEVTEMGTFPQSDSCKWVEGCLVVKLSE